MFCPICGAPIKENHRFCTACGFALGTRPSGTPGAAQPEQRFTRGQNSTKEQPVQPRPVRQPVQQPAQQRPIQRPIQQPAPQPGWQPEAPQKKRKLGLLIGLIAGFVVLAAGAAVLLLLQPWKKTAGDASGTRPGKGGDETTLEVVDVSPAPQPAAEGRVETYDITVWCSEVAVDSMRQQIDAFNRNNPYGLRFNATIQGVSEGAAADTMLADVYAGADLFCFAQDQLGRLVQAGALEEIGGGIANTVREANDAGSIQAASLGGKLYAFPLTADNGYFMYYDKSVIPEGDLDSLEALIRDCENARRYFAFELETSAWYMASFFFATGCVSEWTLAGDGTFTSVKDTFNSPNGLIALKGMKKLMDSQYYVSSSAGEEFSSGAAVVVTGMWNYDLIQRQLGDNMGAADLPSFTVDGKSYHLGSFNGCKLMGIKPQSDDGRSQALHRLAEYLTGEACQMERFNRLSWGPSNRNAQASDAVQANPALAALLQQNQYARPQGQIHGAWWNIGMNLGQEAKAAKTDKDLQKALDNYYNRIAALVSFAVQGDTWGVIGSICGTNWDTDFPMTEMEPNVFRSDKLTLHKGEEFKIRLNADWSVNYGMNGQQDGPNMKVEKDGEYYVWFNAATGDIWLESASGSAAGSPGAAAGNSSPWSVIGSIGGTGWNTDFPMTEIRPGVFRSNAMRLYKGEEFKIRKDGSWTVNYGQNGLQDGLNIVVEQDGTYYIWFDAATHRIWLEKK